MKPKVYFRADGNSKIGLGHVMRCLALADILGNSFYSVFLIQEPSHELKNSILNKCNEIIPLKGGIDLKSEAEFIASSYLKEGDFIVLDGYSFNSQYQKIIFSASVKLVFIDDIYAFHFFAHAVINHAGNVSLNNYSVEWYSKLFIGPQYAILRKPFLTIARNAVDNKRNNSLFINMGGSDPHNYTLEVFLQCKDVDLIENIYIVIGSGYLYRERLEAVVQGIAGKKQVQIYENLTAEEMANVMSKSGMAIGSASTISYEYCCLRGLLFLLKTADNQKNMYDYLIKEGLAFPFEEFKSVAINENLIRSSLEKQKEIFDGSSMENLKAIFERLLLEDKVRFRRAEERDLLLYFNWANELQVRENSINKEAISLEMHKSWFSSKIKDPNSFLYLFEMEGKPIGQVRFDLRGGVYLIGFSLDSFYRNMGLGEIILRKAIFDLNKTSERIVLIAQVQTNNKASEGIFNKLGFKLDRTEVINKSEFYIFKLVI